MIRIWTDGACRGNPGPGGAGVFVVLEDGGRGAMAWSLGETTNNRAELEAVRLGLQQCAQWRRERVEVYTDSRNVIGWLTGEFRVKANRELVAAVREEMAFFKSVSFSWVPGHSGGWGNERADLLAQYGALGGSVEEWRATGKDWRNERGDGRGEIPAWLGRARMDAGVLTDCPGV